MSTYPSLKRLIPLTLLILAHGLQAYTWGPVSTTDPGKRHADFGVDVIRLNSWNSGTSGYGLDTMWANSATNWGAFSTHADGVGAVKSYLAAWRGIRYNQDSAGSWWGGAAHNMGQRLDDIATLSTRWRFTSPNSGRHISLIDVFFDRVAHPRSFNDVNIMIKPFSQDDTGWLNSVVGTGGAYFGSVVDGSITWDIYYRSYVAETDPSQKFADHVFNVIPRTPTRDLKVNILKIAHHIRDNHHALSGSHLLTSLYAGWEPIEVFSQDNAFETHYYRVDYTLKDVDLLEYVALPEAMANGNPVRATFTYNTTEDRRIVFRLFDESWNITSGSVTAVVNGSGTETFSISNYLPITTRKAQLLAILQSMDGSVEYARRIKEIHVNNPASPTEPIISGSLMIEAENFDNSGSIAPFQVVADDGASGEAVVWPNGSASAWYNHAGGNLTPVLTYNFTLSSAATVDIHLRMRGRNHNDDSVWMQLGGAESVWNMVEAPISYGWSLGKTYKALPAGDYTVRISGRDDGTYIDSIFITSDGATPPDLAAAPPVVSGSLMIEAENFDNSGSIAPFQVVADDGASGEAVVWPNGSASAWYNHAGGNLTPVLTYNFTLSSAATVDIHLRMRGRNQNDDSVWMQLGGAESVWNMVEAPISYGWSLGKTYNALPAGDYTVRISGRDDGTYIDSIFITSDGATPPD